MKSIQTGILIHPERASIEARFWSKVDKSGACWEWTGAVKGGGDGGGGGYGHMWVPPRYCLAHRIAYILESGVEIPEGMVIDHACRNRKCVNPMHLRCVTQRENTLADGSRSPARDKALSATCIRGHLLPARVPGKTRQCRECSRIRDKMRVRKPTSQRSRKPVTTDNDKETDR